MEMLGDGKGPRKGLLIDFLGNFARSAKEGLPIYHIDGGPGFIWAASFDQKERGTLRLAAVELSGFSSFSDSAPVLVQATAQTPPSDPESVVQATAQTDQEQLPSESNQTVENLHADLAISINKIAELEKAKAQAERAVKQAEQAKLNAEKAKQEAERVRM